MYNSRSKEESKKKIKALKAKISDQELTNQLAGETAKLATNRLFEELFDNGYEFPLWQRAEMIKKITDEITKL